jgi:phospholipid transport system substrate-binding protein
MHRSFASVVITLLTLFPAVAFSQSSAKGAGDFVNTIVTQTMQIIKEEATPLEEKEDQLTQLFLKKVDTTWMSRFVLGHHWRNTEAQKRDQYQELYKKFLIMSYVPRFREYTDQRIELRNTRSDGSQEYLVETRILSSDTAQPIRVDYKIRFSKGEYKIFDVIAEGVSLIGVQRSDFSSIIARNGVDGLIKALEQKTNS